MQDRLEKLGFIEIFSLDNKEVISQGYIRLDSIIRIYTYMSEELGDSIYAPIDYKIESAAYDEQLKPIKDKINIKYDGVSYTSRTDKYNYIKI